MLERLQKTLSARGIASRRKAEEYIEQGLVKVNGVVAKIGDKADPEKDIIEVDGTVLQARQEMLYYVLNKPVGVVTENVDRSDSETHAPSVRDIIPQNLRGKIYPVGRLDKDSEGLLLLTNDGVLAYRLTHPSFDHEKEYEVEVKERILDVQLKKMREGLNIKGVKTKPAEVKRLNDTTFTITLTEGRNRQIRRMCEKVGEEVVRLKRIRITTLQDDRLKPGEIRPLREEEKKKLLESVGIE